MNVDVVLLIDFIIILARQLSPKLRLSCLTLKSYVLLQLDPDKGYLGLVKILFRFLCRNGYVLWGLYTNDRNIVHVH